LKTPCYKRGEDRGCFAFVARGRIEDARAFVAGGRIEDARALVARKGENSKPLSL
jgi:hypothetical protein